MARYETLVCDHCGKEETQPAKGWVKLSTPKGAVGITSPAMEGEFCGTGCLSEFVNSAAVQLALKEFMDETSRGFDMTKAPDLGGDAAPDLPIMPADLAEQREPRKDLSDKELLVLPAYLVPVDAVAQVCARPDIVLAGDYPEGVVILPNELGYIHATGNGGFRGRLIAQGVRSDA